MFSNIKKQIINLAKNAVLVAETTLGSGNGEEKKKMAIAYIVKNLPLSTFVKNIISVVLSSFIDDVIELSVQYMKTLPKEKGE
jgi:hypothetical protein